VLFYVRYELYMSLKSGPYAKGVGYTVFNWLLPFLEEGNIFRAAESNVNTYVSGLRIKAHVISTYLCPSETSSPDAVINTSNGRVIVDGSPEPCFLFQVRPDWVSNCQSLRAQTPHQTMTTGFADGSVHGISGDIDEEVWARLCNATDGQAVSIAP